MNENELQQRLDALPREARLDAIPPFRFDAPPARRPLRWLAVAATLVIFALGFAAGRLTGGQAILPAQHAAADPIVEIQRTGTEYAAALARGPRDPRAFDVARSTLYGAATEVSRLAPEDGEAFEIRLTADSLDVNPKRPIDF